MSRTIRRKGIHYPTGWFSYSRSDFEEHQAEFLSGDWRGTRKLFHYGLNTYIEYKKKWHRHYVVQHATYDDYITRREAIHHSDAGHCVDKHTVKADFRRMLNRCFRAKHKYQLKVAIIRSEEEDLMLDRFVHDAAWWY